MSDHCENNTKLQRDGTSRQQRLPDALLPNYVDIDGRGLKELIGFVQEFSEEINYYDSENKTEEDWNWKGFFESDPAIEEILLNDEQDEITNFKEYVKEKGGYTEPHMALFLAFLKLFEIAQGDLNKITKKHLDHYYKKILQIGKQPAVADQVFLIFSLARHVEGSHLVEEGTALKAGKDATGRPLAYETNRDLIVNHGQVDQVKALFMDTGRDHRLYESPIANSADGRGAEIETDDMSWKTFGGDDRQQADIGFSIASPLLHLAEGNRTVSVTLQFEKSAQTRSILERMSPDKIPAARYAFKVLFSGEEEWISPLDEEFVMEEDSIHPDVARALLNFVNTATADAIASQVKDDPNRGYSSVRSGYTVGITVAKRIVEKREEKGNFVEIKELKEVSGLGKDKIHDLIYTFSKQIHATHFNPEEGTLTIVRTLDESQPPVTGYNRKNLEDPIETEWPVMKVVLNKNVPPRQDNGHPFTYKHLRDLTVEEAELNVDVEGVKTNVIQNDSGSLDPGKPFQPFGNHPVIGSSFYIGNWEIFQKNLDKLWININWHDLPDESFKAHYDFYTASAESRKNSSFETDIAILNDRKWQTLKSGAKLFDFETDGDEEGDPVNPENTICLVEDSLGEIQRNPAMSGVDLYGTDTQKGFIRLRLQGADFGHKDYAPSYSSQIVVAVTADNGGNNGGNGNGNDPNLPKEPYTPTISELSLDYRSTANLRLTDQQQDEFEKRIEQYFYVHPFGSSEVDAIRQQNSFLPLIESEGNLYIGLENFSGGNNISILFQVAEGSADPDFLQQPVTWSYLSGDQWVEFNEREILSDTTNQLLTSGIITFSVSKNATTDHTLLPEGQVWLRASVDEKTPAVSDLVDIRAQAVAATFKNRQNDPEHLAEPLPAGTISKLQNSDSAIQEVLQPFSSFGGAVQEKSHTYYTRVSERLRHKNRSITIWDYERLVLQKFPSVYKVKCLNHTLFKGSLNEYSEIAPGHVSVIVVSDMINKNAVDPLKPKTRLTTLTEIHEYLESLKAEGVRLHVRNPLYEEIRVEFNVRFREGIDGGYYQGVLNKEIKSFLSPWAYQTTPDVVFGGKIHKSMILHFIERRDYVDFVTCFKMYHVVPAEPGKKAKVRELDEAEATTTASVLGSAPEHFIHVLEEEECACDDNEVSAFKELKVDECGC